ncbi:MAG: hypothetical protein LBC41_00765 [Clostridiales bacterium]|nr:hypothetical protein [Clostridiales bacterium]
MIKTSELSEFLDGKEKDSEVKETENESETSESKDKEEDVKAEAEKESLKVTYKDTTDTKENSDGTVDEDSGFQETELDQRAERYRE